MACVETSDYRVGEVLLNRVMQEQLNEVSSVPVVVSTETQEVESDQEQKIVSQLAMMIRTIGDAVKKDGKLDDAIDGMVGQMTSKTSYWKLVEKMNSFAELARVQVEKMSSMSAWSSGLILVFLGGVILGSVITWKLSSRT